jgi:hypothetical protein
MNDCRYNALCYPDLVEGSVQAQFIGVDKVCAFSLMRDIKHSGIMVGLGFLLLLLIGMSTKGFQLGSGLIVIAWGVVFCALMVTIVVALLYLIIFRQVPGTCLRLGVACLIFFPVSCLYQPLGFLRWNSELAKVENYPLKVEHQLEAYKSANGYYPASLEAVPNLPAPPKGVGYFIYEGNYYFDYPDYWSGLYDGDNYGTKNCGYNYSGQTRQWEHDTP